MERDVEIKDTDIVGLSLSYFYKDCVWDIIFCVTKHGHIC
jgi:hypothetical protein